MRRTARRRVTFQHRRVDDPSTVLGRGIRAELDAFVDLAEVLDAGELARLAAFWAAADGAAREAAQLRAQAAAARTGRRGVVHEIQERLLAWASPSLASRAGQIDAYLPPVGAAGLVPYDRRAALPALLDAALVIAVRDALDEADAEALHGPWREVVEDATA